MNDRIKSESKNCSSIGDCPFCWNTDMHLHKTDRAFGKRISDQYHVVCTGCAAFGPLQNTVEKAIELWNQVALKGKHDQA